MLTACGIMHRKSCLQATSLVMVEITTKSLLLCLVGCLYCCIGSKDMIFVIAVKETERAKVT